MEYNMNAFGMSSAFAAPVAPFQNAWQSPQTFSSPPSSDNLNLPTWLIEEPEAPAIDGEGSIAEWVAQSCIADDDSDPSDSFNDVASRTYSIPNSHHAAPHHPDAVRYQAMGIAHSNSSASIASLSNRGSSPTSSLSSSPSVSRTSSLSSRLWAQSSASSASTSSSASSLASPPRSGSPTSVLGQNANAEAWDLLFAAAGRIQELSLDPVPTKPAGATPPRAAPQPHYPAARHMHQQPAYGPAHMNHSHAGNRYQGNNQQSAQQGNNRRGPQQHRRNNHNGAQTAKGSPLRRVSESESDARKGQSAGNGTGVFLPRAAPAPASAKPSAEGSNPGRKAQRPGATVYLPARLVHVFGLDVDENNNVLLNRAAAGGAAAANGAAVNASGYRTSPAGPKRGGGGAGVRAAPVIKLAPEEMLAGSGRKGGKGGRSRARAAAAAGVAAPAVNLPNDWTY